VCDLVRRLVRLLAEVGESVLVVSYTHSAVDTLLCKLAAESTTGSSCLEIILSEICQKVAKKSFTIIPNMLFSIFFISNSMTLASRTVTKFRIFFCEISLFSVIPANFRSQNCSATF
jgi:hypothetical protein